MIQKSREQLRVIVAILVVAIGALALGYWLQLHEAGRDIQKPIAIEGGTILPNRHQISEFRLIDDQGRPFTNANLQGHWSLLFFGFTHCPLMCPTTLSVLSRVANQYRQYDNADMPQVVFISVDPMRDTPGGLRDYVTHFNPRFVGVTGSDRQLANLTRSLGVSYKKDKANSDNYNYDISHSGVILVVDPTGSWVAALRSPHSAKVIRQDLRYIQQLY